MSTTRFSRFSVVLTLAVISSVACGACGTNDPDTPPSWANDESLPPWAGFFREATPYLVSNATDSIGVCYEHEDGVSCLEALKGSPVVLAVKDNGDFAADWQFSSGRRGHCEGKLIELPAPDPQRGWRFETRSKATCTMTSESGEQVTQEETAELEFKYLHYSADYHPRWEFAVRERRVAVDQLYRVSVTSKERESEANARKRYLQSRAQ